MIAFANAKINIGLQIVDKRNDGYHLLNTIMYPIELKDIIEVVEAEYFDIVQTGLALNLPPEHNIIYKVYSLVKQDFEIGAVNVYLHKIIPFGAGLGGGSSDAIAFLKLIDKLFDLNLNREQMLFYASQVGADCSFFIDNVPAFATGIGDKLSPIDLDLLQYNIVVVKPEFGISTKDAYSRVKPHPAKFDLRNLNNIPVNLWSKYVYNDFEAALFDLYPQLAKLKKQLYENGAIYASLSGSGSALFGIFETSVDLSQFEADFVWQSFET